MLRPRMVENFLFIINNVGPWQPLEIFIDCGLTQWNKLSCRDKLPILYYYIVFFGIQTRLWLEVLKTMCLIKAPATAWYSTVSFSDALRPKALDYLVTDRLLHLELYIRAKKKRFYKTSAFISWTHWYLIWTTVILAELILTSSRALKY